MIFIDIMQSSSMKHLIWTAGLAIVLLACSDSSTTTSTSHNGNHQPDSGSLVQTENHLQDMHESMNAMMQQMKGYPVSGDPDQDFAALMKLHHEGAIRMAQSEVAGGADTEMKAAARKMIGEQQREIMAFDSFLQSHQPRDSSDFGKTSLAKMNGMAAADMKATSVDAAFAGMMVAHHQDAIVMAEDYLKSGKAAALRNMAEAIIRSQKLEVQQLQSWLDKHP
jgi:uncharacterized protein (DUF305 family)